ncbi:hypothetical protein PHYBOEH_009664 [Phytophthora boehmeriae]|uniref:EF-hand domain-containing protein n=1 Tax=Phytophthora boehmeriae TaxID=109152 RepID=A0A8T1VRR0_9STRA|nr:hypothetical protein PHYBOEH_009664 [Phytophthora boehmeriae]
MGNSLNLESAEPIVSDDPILKEYKAATIDDYMGSRESFNTLQETVGDKMTVTSEEFDEIFSLVCQDPLEHFELFDAWKVGKVDVMEVFAVTIVYCDAAMEEKIPLLFDLFDFDHSKMISQNELVLLLLCTTRGLCKALRMPRPAIDTLEALAVDAFSKTSCDQCDRISLDEFSQWVVNERTVMAYLAKFINTRMIYDSQIQCDLMLKEICTTFVNFAEHKKSKEGQRAWFCPVYICEEIIQRHCPAAEHQEIAQLLGIMKTVMESNNACNQEVLIDDKAEQIQWTSGSQTTTDLISMEAFCLVMAPYVAFLAADEDDKHVIDTNELKVLVCLLRGSEPSSSTIACFMESLEQNRDDRISAMEWVLCALETDNRTGTQSFATQLHLLFATADLKGGAVISLPELQAGLTVIFRDHLARVKATKPQALAESAWGDINEEPAEPRRKSRFASVSNLVTELAKEIMEEIDPNQAQKIEWYEFRQHLDYLEQHVLQTKIYIEDHIIPNL